MTVVYAHAWYARLLPPTIISSTVRVYIALSERKLQKRETRNQRFHFEGNFLLKGFFWKMKEI